MTDLQTAARALLKHWDGLQTDDLADAEESVEALRQALAEPQMGIDRGAWLDVPDATRWVDELRGDEPQREWVGFTDEDMAEIRRNGSHSVRDADFRAIEAKLKELNT